jgi:hypothetical protein
MSGKRIGRESNQGDRTPSGDVERTKSAKENLAETARGTSVGSELIKMTRNSPLGFLAGAALTGIVIGVFLRGGFDRA